MSANPHGHSAQARAREQTLVEKHNATVADLKGKLGIDKRYSKVPDVEFNGANGQSATAVSTIGAPSGSCSETARASH